MASVYYTYDASAGSGSTIIVTAGGKAALASGLATQSITYTSTAGAGQFPVVGDVINTVDATPIFLQAIVTAFSTTGFTVLFNVAPDTANYQLPYVITKAT